MQKMWITQVQCREQFFELIEVRLQGLARKYARMLPDPSQGTCDEIIARVNADLVMRMDKFGTKAGSRYGDKNNSVMTCPSAEDASELIFSNFLLSDLVRRVVSTLQKEQFQMKQHEALESVPTPETDNDTLARFKEVMDARDRVLTEREQKAFDLEYQMRTEGVGQRSTANVRTQAHRKAWARAKAKIIAACATATMVVLIAFSMSQLKIAATTESQSKDFIQSFDHQGLLTSSHQGRCSLIAHQGNRLNAHQG